MLHAAGSYAGSRSQQAPTPTVLVRTKAQLLIHGHVAEPRQPLVRRGQRHRAEQRRRIAVGWFHDAAVAEPVRGAEAARLEHVRAVPAEPPAAAEPGAVQRGSRPGVPPLPGPVRQDQGARPGVPLLRPSEPAGAVPLPAPPGLGQPGRPGGPPPRRLRGERGPPGVQPLRGARRAPLPPRGPRAPGPRPRRQLREEEAQEAAAAAGRQQRRPSRPRAPAAAAAPAARRRRLLSLRCSIVASTARSLVRTYVRSPIWPV
uniref:Uncharacterized protein n=1 Tax=Zea mays TaxID=4577 RepID=A0A804MDL5_MAIZE